MLSSTYSENSARCQGMLYAEDCCSMSTFLEVVSAFRLAVEREGDLLSAFRLALQDDLDLVHLDENPPELYHLLSRQKLEDTIEYSDHQISSAYLVGSVESDHRTQ